MYHIYRRYEYIAKAIPFDDCVHFTILAWITRIQPTPIVGIAEQTVSDSSIEVCPAG
jgi:hypothetical protein